MANVLETLYILFKGDTSDLKKSTDEALNSTKKLTTSISQIDKASEKIGYKFMGFAAQIVSAAAAFASINTVLQGLKGAVDYDIALGNASRALGVNVEQLDAWNNAILKTGGTAEGFEGSLNSLAEHFHTTAKVAIQALPQLAEVFSHISRYSAFTYGKALGLDVSTILLLQQGRREVESFLKKQKELGLVTKEQVEISRNYNNSLIDLKHSFRTLFNEISIPALPYIEKFFGLIQKGIDYLIEHKDLVNGFLIGIGILAGSALVALAAVNLPITIIIASITTLIGLFSLLWEDLTVWGKGGKSLFGELNSYIQNFVNILSTGLKLLLENLFPKTTEYFEHLIDILGYVRSFGSSLDFASASPLNSSSSIFNSSAFSRNASINTGAITINTQANSAEGIAKDLGLKIQDHFYQAANYFADNTNA
jgi:hypothetical protein